MTYKKNNMVIAAAVLAIVAGSSIYKVCASSPAKPVYDVSDIAEDDMNEGGLDDLASLALPEAHKRLNYLIAQTGDDLNSVERLKNLQFKLVPSSATDPTHQPPAAPEPGAFTPMTRDQLTAALNAEPAQQLTFSQGINRTSSSFILHTAPLVGLWRQIAIPDANQPVEYQITRLYFVDGQQQSLDQGPTPVNIDPTDGPAREDLAYRVQGVVKPVAKIDVTIRYHGYDGYQKVILNADKPKVTLSDNTQLQLNRLGAERVQLAMTLPWDQRYVVQGMAGESAVEFDPNGSATRTLPAGETVARARAWYQQLRQVQQDFNQFTSSQALAERLTTLAEALPADHKSTKTVLTNVTFPVKPTSVLVYLPGADRIEQLDRQMTSTTPQMPAYIAWDSPDGRAGLVDVAGKWLVPASYRVASYGPAAGIYRLVSAADKDPASTGHYYSLAAKGQLKRLPFDTIDQVIDPQLWLVQRDADGRYGLYDSSKQRFILPMTLEQPRLTGDILIASVKDPRHGTQAKFGAWHRDGTVLLAPEYPLLQREGDFIYGEQSGNSSAQVFDLSGRNLLPAGFKALGSFSGEQPLLVFDEQHQRYAFIDRHGEVLNIKLAYDEVKPFSNGLAVVVKQGLSGAIDVNGELKIPLQYTMLGNFQQRLAAAQLPDNPALLLIDKNNTRVKTLGALDEIDAKANTNDGRYTVYGEAKDGQRVVYDADGALVNNDEPGGAD